MLAESAESCASSHVENVMSVVGVDKKAESSRQERPEEAEEQEEDDQGGPVPAETVPEPSQTSAEPTVAKADQPAPTLAGRASEAGETGVTPVKTGTLPAEGARQIPASATTTTRRTRNQPSAGGSPKGTPAVAAAQGDLKSSVTEGDMRSPPPKGAPAAMVKPTSPVPSLTFKEVGSDLFASLAPPPKKGSTTSCASTGSSGSGTSQTSPAATAKDVSAAAPQPNVKAETATKASTTSSTQAARMKQKLERKQAEAAAKVEAARRTPDEQVMDEQERQRAEETSRAIAEEEERERLAKAEADRRAREKMPKKKEAAKQKSGTSSGPRGQDSQKENSDDEKNKERWSDPAKRSVMRARHAEDEPEGDDPNDDDPQKWISYKPKIRRSKNLKITYEGEEIEPRFHPIIKKCLWSHEEKSLVRGAQPEDKTNLVIKEMMADRGSSSQKIRMECVDRIFLLKIPQFAPHNPVAQVAPGKLIVRVHLHQHADGMELNELVGLRPLRYKLSNIQGVESVSVTKKTPQDLLNLVIKSVCPHLGFKVKVDARGKSSLGPKQPWLTPEAIRASIVFLKEVSGGQHTGVKPFKEAKAPFRY